MEPRIGIGAKAQEQGREGRRDRAGMVGLKESAGLVDEIEIILGGQMQDTAGVVIDGAKPGVGIGGLPGADSELDAGKVGGFRGSGEASANGVEVDVDHGGEDGGVIDEGQGFEAGFPEAAFDVVFTISGAGDEFVGVFHEPA